MSSIQSVLIRFLLKRSNLWNKPLPQIRKNMEKLKAQGMPEGVEASTEVINGVACEQLVPRNAAQGKAILYFHGGGFCLGIYQANRAFVAELAKEAGAAAYMPDYRLAPENPFPAALEDGVAVYKGLILKGYAPKDIVVTGDSSGCALAVSALLTLKQGGEAMPGAMAFITPVFDLAGRGESYKTRQEKDPFKLKDPLGIAKVYVGANNPASPMLSPLYGELEGLPPMLIHGADYDVFLSDAERMADAVRNAGVSVEFKVWRKMWHIFHMQAAIVPESKQALQALGAYVKEKLGIVCGQR